MYKKTDHEVHPYEQEEPKNLIVHQTLPNKVQLYKFLLTLYIMYQSDLSHLLQYRTKVATIGMK